MIGRFSVAGSLTLLVHLAVAVLTLGILALYILDHAYHTSTFVDLAIPDLPPPSIDQSSVPQIIPQGRDDDYTDIFAAFEGRSQCKFGALDLHTPVSQVCTHQQQLLDSMTDGVRTGFNLPFEPRTCDLHFYRTPKICEILSRFEAVIFLGDSMIRHLEQAFAMLMRENYYDGAQGQWKEWVQEKPRHCTCEEQVYSWNCILGETSVKELYEHHGLIQCPSDQRPNLIYRDALTWPLPQPDLDEKIAEITAVTRPLKPYAFVLGHAGWNLVNATATMFWIDQVLERLGAVRPYLAADSPFSYPKVFVSITAAGPLKPTHFMVEQGNEAVARFEAGVRIPVQEKGLGFLGPYNMSLNARIPDGTHSGIRVNLLKAMTIVNWLNMADLRAWTEPPH